MSERLDRAIAALDVGLQDSPESHVYSDVAPTMVDTCVRCQRRDRFADSDFCGGCRAFLLGDGDDPMVWSPGSDGGQFVARSGMEWPVAWYRPIGAPRGGIRYVPPPDFVQWDRDVRMGIARTELTEWSDVARYVDQLRREEHLPESLPLQVTIEPRDHLGVTLSVQWSSAALAEWISVARVGAEAVSWTLEAGGVPHEYAEEWRRLGVGPMYCPDAREIPGDGYARQAIHHRDGNRWNNAPENLAVVDPRENVGGVTFHDDPPGNGEPMTEGATAGLRRWAENYGIAYRNRADLPDGNEIMLAQDLHVWGEAFTDTDGNRIPPNEVRSGIIVDPETPDLSRVEPFCRDADGNVALRWSPQLGTGDPLTDPVAAAREAVARRLAEYNASLPPRVPFPSHPIGDCPRCASGEPVDVGVMRDADLYARNEVGVCVDHTSGPCERGGTMTVPQFHSQRGH